MLKKCRRCWANSILDWQEYCAPCLIKVGEDKDCEAAVEAFVDGFKLKIELVPEELWYKNLRAVVSEVVWNKLRFEAYQKAGNRCEICGYAGKLFCHELWDYDDVGHCQRLRGLEASCEWCNRVHHIGLAEIQLSRLEFNRVVIGHFKRVNNCSFDEYLVAYDKAWELWGRRSEYEWTQDYGEYLELVE